MISPFLGNFKLLGLINILLKVTGNVCLTLSATNVHTFPKTKASENRIRTLNYYLQIRKCFRYYNHKVKHFYLSKFTACCKTPLRISVFLFHFSHLFLWIRICFLPGTLSLRICTLDPGSMGPISRNLFRNVSTDSTGSGL